MGTKLLPKDLELYNFIDEVLYYKWDPIGISDDPDAPRSEYLSYLPCVFSMVKESKSAKEIAFYLSDIQLDRMGLVPNEEYILECAQLIKAFSEDLE